MYQQFKMGLGIYGVACVLGLASVWLSGCGGYDDDESLLDEQELGTAEQGMSAPFTPSYQMGTQTGSSRNRCNRTSSGQVCQVPPTKAIVWDMPAPNGLYYPGTEAATVIGNADAVAGWTFTAVSDCCTQRNVAIVLQADACGTSGTSSNDIRNYACTVFSSPTGLAESAGVVGNFQRSLLCEAHIDISALQSKGANATQRGFLTRHAIAHAVYGCLGMGNRTEATAQGTRQDMNSGVERSALTSGESCTLAAFTPGTPSVWNTTGNCPSD